MSFETGGGFEVWTPRGPILGADKGQNIPPQPLPSRLGFWAGTESCWETIPDH